MSKLQKYSDVLFETIFNSNGTLTSDWDADIIIEPIDIRDNNEVYKESKFDIRTGDETDYQI